MLLCGELTYVQRPCTPVYAGSGRNSTAHEFISRAPINTDLDDVPFVVPSTCGSFHPYKTLISWTNNQDPLSSVWPERRVANSQYGVNNPKAPPMWRQCRRSVSFCGYVRAGTAVGQPGCDRFERTPRGEPEAMAMVDSGGGCRADVAGVASMGGPGTRR